MSLPLPEVEVQKREEQGLREHNPSCGICSKLAEADVAGQSAYETKPPRREDWPARRARFVDEHGKAKTELCSWAAYVKSAETCATCEKIVNRLRFFRDSWRCTSQECVFLASPNSDEQVLIVRCKVHTNVAAALYTQSTFSHTLNLTTQKGRAFPAETIDINTIQVWTSDCKKHKLCLEQKSLSFRNLKPPPSLMLIDVEQNCLVRLSEKDQVRYVCLSYVWGKLHEPFTTTKENLQELLRPQSLKRYWDCLPKTIQDAIILIQKLQLRYLWIDRLCIVQNDQAMAREQISHMGSIYAQAYFTVIVAYNHNDQYGIPGVSTRKPHVELLPFGPSKCLLLSDQSSSEAGHFGGELEYKEWYQRAWTYQERLISSRCLIFYDESVKWCCSEAVWHEFFDLSLRYRESSVYDGVFESKVWPDVDEFTRLVNQYSRRDLTYSGDALNAFSAVLQCLEPSYPGGFLIGIPEFFFDYLLFWEPSGTAVRRDDFPSWSWLGWQGYKGMQLPHLQWGPTSGFCSVPRTLSRKPLVKWYKQDLLTGHNHLINSEYSTWLSYKNDNHRPLPSGWTRQVVRSDDPIRDSIFGWKEGESYVLYVHETLSDAELSVPPTTRWLHPVPTQHIDKIDHTTHQWSPFLKTRAQLVNMRIAPRSPGVQKLHDLYGACSIRYGEFICGQVFAQHAVGDIHPFIAIAQDASYRSLWSSIENQYQPQQDEGYLSVFMLQKENDIWLRLGVGWVDAHAWRQMGPQETDITLG